MQLLQTTVVKFTVFQKMAAFLDLLILFRNASLNGNTLYFTNGTVPEPGDFLTTKRAADVAYSVSVDAIIFQKAFAELFATIKKAF